MTKTWLITGAGRGMGVEFARAALAAGHNVVATGRNPETVRAALGEHDNLLVAALDVNDAHSAEAAAAAPSSASVASTCCSTTPAASSPASSRS
jgi:NAD(P)-dependent dehydrogenase (short-subunit alcohol dehydrogenase family)